MEFHGIPWHSTEFHGIPWNSWNSMEFYEILWDSMEFYRIPWSSMESNPMEFHGTLCNSMEAHGIPWNSMDFQRIPWNRTRSSKMKFLLGQVEDLLLGRDSRLGFKFHGISKNSIEFHACVIFYFFLHFRPNCGVLPIIFKFVRVPDDFFKLFLIEKLIFPSKTKLSKTNLQYFIKSRLVDIDKQIFDG